jgi:hypothetical protein
MKMQAIVTALLTIIGIQSAMAQADCTLREQRGTRIVSITNYAVSGDITLRTQIIEVDYVLGAATATVTRVDGGQSTPRGTLEIIDADECKLMWTYDLPDGLRFVEFTFYSTTSGPGLPASAPCGPGCTTTRQRQGTWLGDGETWFFSGPLHEIKTLAAQIQGE